MNTPNKTGEPPQADEDNYPWLEYRTGDQDINGNVITAIHARCPEFVIYFCKPGKLSELYYECTDELLEVTAQANAYLAQINRLASDEEKKRRETLEYAADFYEMLLCEQQEQAEAGLKDLVVQLATWRETVGRLYYQSATLVVALVVWLLFMLSRNQETWPWLNHWLLAAALGATGGFFSVCLNLGRIRVNVNQSLKVLYYAGGTRAAVAVIAAIACLLAVRAKLILGAFEPDAAALSAETLSAVVMFFLFLAGFSETFIPNVLSEAEQNALAGRGKKEADLGAGTITSTAKT